MARRSVVATLLLIFVAQVAGGMILASVCYEPCPDDAGQRSCPPFCTFCTTCAHAQQAVVHGAAPLAGTPLVAEPIPFTPQPAGMPARLASDIFHVPLLG